MRIMVGQLGASCTRMHAQVRCATCLRWGSVLKCVRVSVQVCVLHRVCCPSACAGPHTRGWDTDFDEVAEGPRCVKSEIKVKVETTIQSEVKFEIIESKTAEAIACTYHTDADTQHHLECNLNGCLHCHYIRPRVIGPTHCPICPLRSQSQRVTCL